MSFPIVSEDMRAGALARDESFAQGVIFRDEVVPETRTSASAVSWGAILAGAAAAATLSLLLMMLGTGLGLSAVSPWAHSGVSAMTFGVSTIIWLTFSQLAAAGLGGYLAGRLRTKWVAAQTKEVYFRDTAHGFLAWSVAALTTAALLTSATWSIASGGIEAGAAAVKGAAAGAVAAGSAAIAGVDDKEDAVKGVMSYFVNTLFRKDGTAIDAAQGPEAMAASVAEVGGIFAQSLRTGTLAPADAQYVSRLIAQHTGVTQQEAQAGVTKTFDDVKTAMMEAKVATQQAVDSVRKASAFAALWLFVSLLIGAFVASVAAAFGGRNRDKLDIPNRHPA